MIPILIPVGRIEPNPWQPRQNFDPAALEELAADIQANGLIQPPTARLVSNGGTQHRERDAGLYGNEAWVRLQLAEGYRVQLVAGERRWRAYRLLDERGAEHERHVADLFARPDGFAEMPVVLASFDDERMIALAWTENARRADIGPVEEARYFHRLALPEAEGGKGWTHGQIATALGIGRTVVSHRVRLLGVGADLLAKVESGEMPVGVAFAVEAYEQMPAAVHAKVASMSGSFKAVTNPADATAEEIRSDVRRVVTWQTKDLGRASFPLDAPPLAAVVELPAAMEARVAEARGKLVQPDTCAGCPMRFEAPVKLGEDGTADRCAGDDCYGAKATLASAASLLASSMALELPVIGREAKRDHFSDYSGSTDKEALKVALGTHKERTPKETVAGGTRCAHMALDVDHTWSAGPKGIKASYACTRPGGCLCKKSTASAATREDNRARKAVERLEEAAAEKVAALLTDVPTAVLMMALSEWERKGLSAETPREVVVARVAKKLAPSSDYRSSNKADVYRTQAAEWSAAVGFTLELPADEAPAPAFNAKERKVLKLVEAAGAEGLVPRSSDVTVAKALAAAGHAVEVSARFYLPGRAPAPTNETNDEIAGSIRQAAVDALTEDQRYVYDAVRADWKAADEARDPGPNPSAKLKKWAKEQAEKLVGAGMAKLESYSEQASREDFAAVCNALGIDWPANEDDGWDDGGAALARVVGPEMGVSANTGDGASTAPAEVAS